MRLLPYNGRIVQGRILFQGRDLTKSSELSIRKTRWKDISIVFQGAMNSLNPIRRVGQQIAEPIILHEKVDEEVAMKRVEDLLALVGIHKDRIRDYPHEFSGGMRQRVMIAMALACNPKLVIADEPVTALDVMIQAQIIELLERLRRELDLSMILISHDLSVMADTCEKVAIMYAGKIVEFGRTLDVFTEPKHPYTSGLVAAFPDIRGSRTMPEAIPGDVPSLISPPKGCVFHPRCRFAFDRCTAAEPALTEIGPGRFAACFLSPDVQEVKPRIQAEAPKS
jgi:peptide/nickel transport system ATP-binding protein